MARHESRVGVYKAIIPVPGDYDGDGLTDIAVWRQSTWFILLSSTGGSYNPGWGLQGDTPVYPSPSPQTGGGLQPPPPPIPCGGCGMNQDLLNSQANPQAVFAPNSSNQLYAYCYQPPNDQTPIPCHMSLATEAYADTNGHFHTNPPPPVSSVSPTTNIDTSTYQNYEVPVTLTTTPVGQIESLYVSDDDDGYVSHWDYGVGYNGFVYLDNSNILYQTGGNSATSMHGDNTWNHWMTNAAATGLQRSIVQYLNLHNNPGGKICINDMSLPIGGIFDIENDWNPQHPHLAHDRGTSADIAGTANAGSPSSCPSASMTVNISQFLRVCKDNGASRIHSVPHVDHAHCNWITP